MQRLINNHNPERVLFITYRQTLARDIMRNVGKLECKIHLESYDDPIVLEAPRLITHLDSLLNLVYKTSDVMCSDGFELSYDLIVLDEKRKSNESF
jgi:hypothetical protein